MACTKMKLSCTKMNILEAICYDFFMFKHENEIVHPKIFMNENIYEIVHKFSVSCLMKILWAKNHHRINFEPYHTSILVYLCFSRMWKFHVDSDNILNEIQSWLRIVDILTSRHGCMKMVEMTLQVRTSGFIAVI